MSCITINLNNYERVKKISSFQMSTNIKNLTKRPAFFLNVTTIKRQWRQYFNWTLIYSEIKRKKIEIQNFTIQRTDIDE